MAEDSGANPINVLANDTDPDTGDTRTITAITQGANGTVAITGGGTGLTYTPTADYVGPDTFTYTITDAAGSADTATVTVTVTNVNDAPVAVDDTATVAEDSTDNAITVLGNDTDPDTGDTRTITAITQPTNGTVAITGGGTGLTYTPDRRLRRPRHLHLHHHRRRRRSPTPPPSPSPSPTSTTPRSPSTTPPPWPRTPPTTRSTCWPTTPTPTPATPCTITAVTQPTNGTVVITGGGTGVTYTPDANFTGTDTFTYTITDGAFATDTATVSVTVTAVNDAPTADDFAGTVAEDSTNIAVDLTTLTDDVDGDALTYTITTPLANGTLTPTGTPGIYTYTPNANFTGPDSFTYTVTDGTGSPTPAPCRSPSPPSTTPRSPSTTPPPWPRTPPPTSITVLGNDTDADGTTPTVTAVSNPTGGTVDPDRRPGHLHPAPRTTPAPPASTTPSPTAP